jgi:hypothetical protein
LDKDFLAEDSFQGSFHRDPKRSRLSRIDNFTNLPSASTQLVQLALIALSSLLEGGVMAIEERQL